MAARSISMTLLMLTGVPWATGWTLLGLWLLGFAGAHTELAGFTLEMSPVIRVFAGVTALAAGQLVFLCFMADRVYPRASRWLVWPIELGLSLAMFLGLAVLGLAAIGVPL
ncbi:MAG: hypothetical protein KF866_04755 [Phycisphaeraceae bacterium]|nr:hypothetical protein [Phycisphaeraceae bacterium]MCW5754040.1 hypothetical protein [Phycisphaeraceae bacterium]